MSFLTDAIFSGALSSVPTKSLSPYLLYKQLHASNQPLVLIVQKTSCALESVFSGALSAVHTKSFYQHPLFTHLHWPYFLISQ